ncbi:MAG: DUF3341 domain-containing protein [Proteobacteria bacterium]|nr:DUF3341 domain-containing protein [Pseudomonadota bacterium]
MDNSILGKFQYVDDLLAAAETCKQSGYAISIISPVPLVHEIEHTFGEGKNPIKYFTGVGAVTGLLFGILFTIITSLLYVLPRAGRPIIAIPPTLLISYETTILFGVLFTLLGFIVLALVPYFKESEYDVEIAIDAFGLRVHGVGEDKFSDIEKVMRENGSSDVKRIEKK